MSPRAQKTLPKEKVRNNEIQEYLPEGIWETSQPISESREHFVCLLGENSKYFLDAKKRKVNIELSKLMFRGEYLTNKLEWRNSVLAVEGYKLKWRHFFLTFKMAYLTIFTYW